jgi:broad specificity phosphatase PhoE/GNAT superfamily N-acetyltransferase
LLARHGESKFNNTHQFAGQVDVGLTDNGCRQAENLRHRLAGEQIDAVYTSTLSRARTTAEIVISGRDLAITECPELQEISYGDIEGLTYADIQKRFPKLANQIHHFDPAMEFPGGESFLGFIKRVESFKERLTKHGEKETVLIVAHGGPLRTLILSLLGIDQSVWWQLRLDNASLSVIDIYPPMEALPEAAEKSAQASQRVILSLFNETDFLTDQPKYHLPPQANIHEQANKATIPETKIRLLEAPDIPVIYTSFKKAGWHRTPGMLEKYLAEQEKEERIILVAYYGTEFAGYTTVKWHATDYLPFAEKKIPEIMDLNVLPPFQKRKIATRLVDEAERRIFERSPAAGIGVGLFADYGAAQQMYVRRGYIPDGSGIHYKGQPVKPYSDVRMDDDLVLFLIKKREKEA